MDGYRRRRIGVGGYLVIGFALAVLFVIAIKAWLVILVALLVIVIDQTAQRYLNRKRKGQVPRA